MRQAATRSSDTRTTFVTTATYESRKGQDILLEAIQQLDSKTRARARFEMAGRPLETAFYDQLRARSRDLDNVRLLGPLDHEQSIELLRHADVVVCPSRDETMPIFLLEGMSLGKALISTDVGGVSEWLRDGQNALMVPPQNPAALSAALARCINDRELVRKLAAEARETFARHFTLECFGEHIEAILQQTIEAREGTAQPGTYGEWADLYETPRRADRIALRHAIEVLTQRPLISILLPVHNPDFGWLSEAIDSVQRQIYGNWELCIADDASTDHRVRPFLQEKAASDERIKLVFRATNGHISACSNSALALATGEWCSLLDQDDTLAEHALAMVACELAEHPDAGLIYSDEDKLDLAGARSNPFFKTDWNPELFLGQNYINHLGSYRTSLLRVIGGFREGLEGSQDYDLALRCIERLQAHQVRHIPRILYHWRMVPGSLAEVRDAKPYAKEAARLALNDHLRRSGIAGRAEPCPENIESHRVIYDLPEPRPRVAVIILAKKQSAWLPQCLESVRPSLDSRDEIIIVSDAGIDADLGLAEKRGVTVLQDDFAGSRGRMNNLAAARAAADMLLFLDAGESVGSGCGWRATLVGGRNLAAGGNHSRAGRNRGCGARRNSARTSRFFQSGFSATERRGGFIRLFRGANRGLSRIGRLRRPTPSGGFPGRGFLFARVGPRIASGLDALRRSRAARSRRFCAADRAGCRLSPAAVGRKIERRSFLQSQFVACVTGIRTRISAALAPLA